MPGSEIYGTMKRLQKPGRCATFIMAAGTLLLGTILVSVKTPSTPPLRLLVVHRRLPDVDKGGDARLVALINDLGKAGAIVSYLALNVSKQPAVGSGLNRQVMR